MQYGEIARTSLEKHGFHFAHALGQNFLLDDDFVEEIVRVSGVQRGQNVLEIGPGAGVMTAYMASTGARVAALELDHTLEPVLKDVLHGLDVRVLYGDARKRDLAEVAQEVFGDAPYIVCANLPYYITSEITRAIVRLARKPLTATLMVQKEAAERILSSPGEKSWCALAAQVAYFSQPETILHVPREVFTPRPHVESALLRLTLYAPDAMPVRAQNEDVLLRLIDACFAMRRKTLANNLTQAFSMPREQALSALTEAEIGHTTRGEVLTIEQIARLADILCKIVR